MTRKRWIVAGLSFGTVLLVSAPAHANVMIPIIVGGWFGMFFALIPIIVIESIVLVWVGAGVGSAVLSMAVANLASTIAGVPLAIVLEFVVMALTQGALYDESWDGSGKWFNEKLLPIGLVLLLIPFFLLSWWIEAPIALWFLDEIPVQTVDHAVRDANLLTYGILALLVGGALSIAVWRLADERSARARVARTDSRLKANHRAVVRYVEGFRTRQRDIELRAQPRPVLSADLLESWRLANEQARRGVTWLKAAEVNIGRRQRANYAEEAGNVPTSRRAEAA
jgi:hypothetical protein